MPTHYWLNVDERSNTAHLIALELPVPLDRPTSNAVTGYAFRNVQDTISFASHVLEVSHGDADSIIMAQDLHSQDDVWIGLDKSAFDAAIALGSIDDSLRSRVLGYRIRDGRLCVLTGDEIEPDITRLCH